jgi:GT2 family glycosyltransferase
MIDISVIIVNYKSWEVLGECLDALKIIITESFCFEIIVVDNFSNDGRIDEFENLYPNIKFIKNTGNNGFANGCNIGAESSTGSYLLFLNPDTIANENALFELWKSAKNNPDFAIITCRQINEKLNKYKEIRFFPSLKTLNGTFRILDNYLNKRIIKKDFCESKKVVFPEWATGAVIFISSKWFKKINGWNEKYWLYFEDVDICKRAADHGGKVVLLRNVTILHKHGGATRLNIKTKVLTKTEVLISQHIYFNEHLKGINRIFAIFILVISLLLTKTVMGVLGFIFFFVPKIYVNFLILRNLLNYYFYAIYNKTWTSPRSVLYKIN